MRFFQKLITSQDGAATLEAIIVLPLAISLMTGAIDFGRAWLNFGSADKAVRDAARYLARVPYAYICGPADWGKTNAVNLATSGSISGGGTLLPGWTITNVTVVVPNCSGGALTSPPSEIEITAKPHYTGIMLGFLNINSGLTVTVRHREVYVGG